MSTGQRPGEELVVTVDIVAEGVHFFADDPPDSVARKALRVNLSDLAAKGATPFGYLMALALPADWTRLGSASSPTGSRPISALRRLAARRRHGHGGGRLTMSITAIGRSRRGAMVAAVRRTPGDAVLVSGTIGDAALGLACGSGTIGAAGRRRGPLDRYLHAAAAL